MCTGASSCADDPLLDCESPGAAGPLGFSIDPVAQVDAGAGGAGGMSGAAPTYCAPKLCTVSSDCGLAGACTDGTHCVPAPDLPTPVQMPSAARPRAAKPL